MRDPRVVTRLHANVAETLRDRKADPRDAAVVALAAAGKLRTVFGWRKAVAAQEAAEAAAG